MYEKLKVIKLIAYFYLSSCMARQTSAVQSLLFSGFRNLIHMENTSLFHNITSCSPLKYKQSCAWYLLHVSFLPGLFFAPEDGGDIFLRNFG
jgi:hypothetical protein